MGYRSRKIGFRRTRKVFVIAAEGARTEPIYFGEFKPSRAAVIDLQLVPNPQHKSKPSEVLKRLKRFALEKGIKDSDELWLVIDRDAWNEDDLNAVSTECRKLGYFLALSNPCFELWLYLHYSDNRPFNSRHDCQKQLAVVCPGYEKGNYDVLQCSKLVSKAITRAKALDTEPDQLWPKNQCSWVYRLMEKLIEGM